MINPEEDGITHINVYSKGKTALGQFLTNFSYSPVETEDGHFDSIEGYWYWLGTNEEGKEELRHLYGFNAKKLGRELRADDWQEGNEEFANKIRKAIKIKLETYPLVVQRLKEINLPLKHYYVFGGKVVEPENGKWVVEYLDSFRTGIEWKFV